MAHLPRQSLNTNCYYRAGSFLETLPRLRAYVDKSAQVTGAQLKELAKRTYLAATTQANKTDPSPPPSPAHLGLISTHPFLPTGTRSRSCPLEAPAIVTVWCLSWLPGGGMPLRRQSSFLCTKAHGCHLTALRGNKTHEIHLLWVHPQQKKRHGITEGGRSQR